MSNPAVITELVQTMRKLAGDHPGFRPVHAKGIVCAGTFRPSADAKRVSRAAHLQGTPVEATIRFANSSGNPEAHDGAPSVRSLAMKFQLPDGKPTDVLANSVEGFVARLMKKPVPASYAQASYHAEHAFRFVAAGGASVFGRYHFLPEADEAYLSPEEGTKRSANFLREELEGRLRTGPVVFRLQLQLAEVKDATDDPTVLWPAERPRVELGRLEITGISPASLADERRLIFDPTNLTPGIEASTDPVLLARSAAYSISYDERTKGA